MTFQNIASIITGQALMQKRGTKDPEFGSKFEKLKERYFERTDLDLDPRTLFDKFDKLSKSDPNNPEILIYLTALSYEIGNKQKFRSFGSQFNAWLSKNKNNQNAFFYKFIFDFLMEKWTLNCKKTLNTLNTKASLIAELQPLERKFAYLIAGDALLISSFGGCESKKCSNDKLEKALDFLRRSQEIRVFGDPFAVFLQYKSFVSASSVFQFLNNITGDESNINKSIISLKEALKVRPYGLLACGEWHSLIKFGITNEIPSQEQCVTKQ